MSNRGGTGTALRAPYPWCFGGKSAVAPLVWRRFGDVRNYVEPFFGSGAVTLLRPHWPFSETRIETVNDADGFVSNFWRALQHEPECVAQWADWPVNEADLHARHLWLVNSPDVRGLLDRLRDDPEVYDCKIAGWWVWGCCQWIGSGWCHHPEWQQLPHLGDAGRGIHRPSQQLPHLGNAGMGIHRPSQQLPHLGNAGRVAQCGYGHPPAEPETPSPLPVNGDLYAYFAVLADRLRHVRVCCGDWSRVCGPTPTVKQGLTGVFLDPPYADEAERKADLYAVDSGSIAHDVRTWCVENGGDKRLRIALCGYAGEGHEELERHGWDVVAWKTRGGYGSQSDGETTNGRDNARKERVWFSPHCLKATKLNQREMFDT